MTILTVSLLTFCESLESARETVDFDIPSSLAMSFMVICLMRLNGSPAKVIYKLIINTKILQILIFGNGCIKWERLRERCRRIILKYLQTKIRVRFKFALGIFDFIIMKHSILLILNTEDNLKQEVILYRDPSSSRKITLRPGELKIINR